MSGRIPQAGWFSDRVLHTELNAVRTLTADSLAEITAAADTGQVWIRSACTRLSALDTALTEAAGVLAAPVQFLIATSLTFLVALLSATVASASELSTGGLLVVTGLWIVLTLSVMPWATQRVTLLSGRRRLRRARRSNLAPAGHFEPEAPSGTASTDRSEIHSDPAHSGIHHGTAHSEIHSGTASTKSFAASADEPPALPEGFSEELPGFSGEPPTGPFDGWDRRHGIPGQTWAKGRPGAAGPLTGGRAALSAGGVKGLRHIPTDPGWAGHAPGLAGVTDTLLRARVRLVSVALRRAGTADWSSAPLRRAVRTDPVIRRIAYADRLLCEAVDCVERYLDERREGLV